MTAQAARTQAIDLIGRTVISPGAGRPGSLAWLDADERQAVPGHELGHPVVAVDVRDPSRDPGTRTERVCRTPRQEDLHDPRGTLGRVPESVRHASRLLHVRARSRGEHIVADAEADVARQDVGILVL